MTNDYIRRQDAIDDLHNFIDIYIIFISNHQSHWHRWQMGRISWLNIIDIDTLFKSASFIKPYATPSHLTRFGQLGFKHNRTAIHCHKLPDYISANTSTS